MLFELFRSEKYQEAKALMPKLEPPGRSNTPWFGWDQPSVPETNPVEALVRVLARFGMAMTTYSPGSRVVNVTSWATGSKDFTPLATQLL